MYTKHCKKVTPLHLHIAYLSGFKGGGAGLDRRVGGVCNLIYKFLFHYYSNYSTSTFLLFICFLPSVCFLPFVCFLLSIFFLYILS
jgi:hypothetical protein